MAYRDENGKITIDDVAAGEDIRKIERAQAILQNALQSLRAAQTEGANSKGQTAQAIYDKSQELINQIQRLDNNLEETTNYIRHKTTMRNALSLFRRFQLIETLDRDLTNEESRILIYDSILLAVRVEDIRQAYEKLEQYRKGKTANEETDTDEAD